jgi:hypothetical protein
MKRLLCFLVLLSFLGASQPALAALPANSTTWEVEQAGSNNNGGCFIAGSSGTDRSQQSAAFTAYTDLVIGGTTTLVTSVAHPFGATDVGNCINIVSGTGCTVGRYQVVSVTTLVATLDRAAGTAASVCTANLGGALATLATLNSNMAQGHQAWVKTDATYSISTGVNFNFTSSGSAVSFPQISGYTTTRGDNGLVVVQATAGGFSMITISNNNNLYGLTLRNFDLDCNSQVNCQGLSQNDNYTMIQNVKARNWTNGGFNFNNGFGGGQCTQCYATGGTGLTAAITLNGGWLCNYCVAAGNAGPGFSIPGGSCYFCIAANNSGATSDGFNITPGTPTTTSLLFCVAYTNGRDGIHIVPQNPPPIFVIENTIAFGNVGKAINATSTIPAGGYVLNFNAYASGALTGVTAGTNDVILSADPFTNGAGNIFQLNSTAGGGAAVKGLGFPGVLLVGGTGHPDIGTLQSGTGGATGNGVSAYAQ